MADTARLTTALSGSYRIERELGAGGMATVYLARDIKHDREVALKVLRPELGAVLGADRFLAEIKITARLDHPHILTLIDSGVADGFLYYVLPFVRGESLRDLLGREKQLGVEQALSITRQIASALDYAHQHGVVHRDIKPENILLHEGEAVLADFGIALAVKEAGGNRLTETGLSLGTPQYMSPEQATGDRQLDARSDVYSLGAVLYEMLAGEPPVTGPTAQAMIAKLITERPTRLRVVRDTVPEGIDTAVAKALSKIAADRFASAGEFGQALSGAAAAPPAKSRHPLLIGAAAAVVVVAVLLGILLGKGRGTHGPAVVLRDRTQLTSNGRVTFPTISPDGKELAYSVQDCSRGTCRYAIEVQDLGTSSSRTLFNAATAVYAIQWSPDRRNLILLGTVGGRYGNYLISTVGGPPRLLTSGSAGFWAGGDSLLIMEIAKPDTVHWVKVAGLDGVARDSIRVSGQATYTSIVAGVSVSPWMLVTLTQGPRLEVRAVDRRGHEGGHWVLQGTGATLWASADALWAQLFQSGANARPPIVRVPFDGASGRFAATWDTLYNGLVTQWDVTADGASLVLDEGTTEYSGWVEDLAEAIRGSFPASKKLISATTPMQIMVARQGSRVAIERLASAGITLSTVASPGAAEVPVALSGRLANLMWVDSVTMGLAERLPDGIHFSLVDVRTGARSGGYVARDSAIADFARVGDAGWAWLPSDGKHIMISLQGAAPRAVPLPDWYLVGVAVTGARDGQHLAFLGWNNGTADTLRLSELSVADGKITRWTEQFGESGDAHYLADGSILMTVNRTKETAELLKLRGPGQVQSLGTIPRPIAGISTTEDARRAGITIKDYHGDAWMSRVVRP